VSGDGDSDGWKYVYCQINNVPFIANSYNRRQERSETPFRVHCIKCITQLAENVCVAHTGYPNMAPLKILQNSGSVSNVDKSITCERLKTGT